MDEASKDAGRQYAKKKRPNFNFKEMGIPIGATLHSNVNEETCITHDERQVEFRGEVMSLTRATKMVLDNDYAVAPGPTGYITEG